MDRGDAVISLPGVSWAHFGDGIDLSDVDGDGVDDVLVLATKRYDDDYLSPELYTVVGPVTSDRSMEDADGTVTAGAYSALGSATVLSGSDLDADGREDVALCATGASAGGLQSAGV